MGCSLGRLAQRAMLRAEKAFYECVCGEGRRAKWIVSSRRGTSKRTRLGATAAGAACDYALGSIAMRALERVYYAVRHCIVWTRRLSLGEPASPCAAGGGLRFGISAAVAVSSEQRA